MRQFAPAKVNLALHVTGRRKDGYHLLDSLVVFAGVGDWVDVREAPELRLSVTGPRAAGVPADQGNLVWRAAELFAQGRGASITLDKHLPHAGGIGGGSSDAAATLRALAAVWGTEMPDAGATLTLGADVPVCVGGTPARMSGIGEVLADVPAVPPAWLVLVNPGVEVPTGPVFKALERVNNAPLPVQAWHDLGSFAAYLHETRNDLQPPALGLVPVIGDVLDAIQVQPGCVLSRMSGSGGTCFGIFASQSAAQAAADALSRHDWWSVAAPILEPPAR